MAFTGPSFIRPILRRTRVSASANHDWLTADATLGHHRGVEHTIEACHGGGEGEGPRRTWIIEHVPDRGLKDIEGWLCRIPGGEGTKSWSAPLKLKHIQFTPDGGDKSEPAITRCRGKRMVYIDEAVGVSPARSAHGPTSLEA
jgi:hypothetical protein